MNYELAKQLKEAGFPQIYGNFQTKDGCVYERASKNRAHVPTLSELIDACGEDLDSLNRHNGDCECEEDDCEYQWDALNRTLEYAPGKTPEEAVAKLWLKLNI